MTLGIFSFVFLALGILLWWIAAYLAVLDPKVVAAYPERLSGSLVSFAQTVLVSGFFLGGGTHLWRARRRLLAEQK